MNIAFIGLGNMGSGMARNLLRAGHHLIVYNRSRDKAEPLAHAGAEVASAPAEACRHCDAVFTMLSDDRAVEEVVFGDGGFASTLARNAVHICTSTISIAFARQLAKRHEERGQHYLSAPVFGRPEAAENRKLVVVAAGERTVIERYHSLFDALSRHTFIAGSEPWHANAIKLCGNFMIATMMEAFGEAFANMRKAGVDHHLFLAVMNELFGSPVYANYGAVIADENFQPAAFTVRLGLKDIRLVMEAAEELGVPMPFASVVRDHLISGVAQGGGELDWSSIARVIARDAGLAVDQQQAAAQA